MKLYVTFDRVSGQSSPIFEQVNDLTAIRMFQNVMKNEPFKNDYDLVSIGEIDRKTCQLTVKEPLTIFAYNEEVKANE
jgi:hypothetical protein